MLDYMAPSVVIDPNPRLVSSYFRWPFVVGHGFVMVSVGPFVHYMIEAYTQLTHWGGPLVTLLTIWWGDSQCKTSQNLILGMCACMCWECECVCLVLYFPFVDRKVVVCHNTSFSGLTGFA